MSAATPGRRQRFLIGTAANLGPGFVNALGHTLRIRSVGHEHLARAREAGNGRVLYAIWHSHMLLAVYRHRAEGIRVLVSLHHDGEIIARIIAGLGFATVRGSTTRGGRDAFFRMVRESRDGHDIAITPDGPRGPREVVGEGVVRLAQWSGLPIMAFAACGPRDWTLNSWDHFRIPRPGSRVSVVYAPHLLVPRDLTPEAVEHHRMEIQKRFEAVTAEAMKW